MSGYRDRQDQERLDRMYDDEYAPASVDEPGALPDFRRSSLALSGDASERAERHTYDGWREMKILRGICPHLHPNCSGGLLDDEHRCGTCKRVSPPKAAA